MISWISAEQVTQALIMSIDYINDVCQSHLNDY